MNAAKSLIIPVVCLAVVLSAGVVSLEARETRIHLSDVPARVKKAALDAVVGIKLTEAEMETTPKGIVYELEGISEGKEYEITVTPEGRVLQVEIEGAERHLPLSSVPDNVKEAARDAVQGIKLTGAIAEKTPTSVVYELIGTLDGQTYEIEVGADGEVLEVEVEGDDEDDDDEHDDDHDDDHDHDDDQDDD